jgi:hypothetical protein
MKEYKIKDINMTKRHLNFNCAEKGRKSKVKNQGECLSSYVNATVSRVINMNKSDSFSGNYY